MVTSTHKENGAVAMVSTVFTLASVHHRTGKKMSKSMILLNVEKTEATTMIVVRTLMGLHVLMVTSLLLGNHAMMESMVMMSKNTPAHQIQEEMIGKTVTGKKNSKPTILLSAENGEATTMTAVRPQIRLHVLMVTSLL
jgi:hypothetical protein